MKKTGVLLTVIFLAAMIVGCALPPGGVRYRAAKKYEFDLDEQPNIIYGTKFRKPVTINLDEEITVDLIDCVFKKDIIINAKAGSTTSFLGMCRFAEGVNVIFNQASEGPQMPILVPHYNINVVPNGRAVVIAQSDETVTVNGKEYTFEDCQYAVKAVDEGSPAELEEGKEYPAFGVHCHPESESSISVIAYERMWEPARQYP